MQRLTRTERQKDLGHFISSLRRHSSAARNRVSQNFKVQSLQTQAELLQAQRLLYKCYVDELGWKPPPGNPSEWHIQSTSPVGPILVDRFDVVANWIGAVNDKHNVVGIARLIARHVDHDYKLEMELYDDKVYSKLNAHFPITPEDYRNKIVEGNRMAVHPAWRGGTVMQKIVAEACCWGRENEKHLITAAPYARSKELMVEAGAKEFGIIQYDAADEESCSSLLIIPYN